MTANKKKISDSLKKRTKENHKNRNKGGITGKKAVDIPDDLRFKPEEGKNKIDIIPYVVATDHHPQRDEGYKKGEIDYVLDYFEHSYVGATGDSFLCLKKTFGLPCPICEEQQRMRASGKYDKEDIKELNPSRRVLYNVIDKNDEDKGIQLFPVSHFLFEKELLEEAEAAEDEIIIFADIEDGRTIFFRAVEDDSMDSSFLRYKSFKFYERDEELDENLIEQAISLDELLIIPTYEEVKTAFESNSNDKMEDDEAEDDEVEDDEVEEIPVKKRRQRKKENECPYGHKFGVDIDREKDCKKCDEEVWQKCAEENEE